MFSCRRYNGSEKLVRTYVSTVGNYVTLFNIDSLTQSVWSNCNCFINTVFRNLAEPLKNNLRLLVQAA